MSKEQVSYYVTNTGLAATLQNEDVLHTMQGILNGRAHPMTVRAFHKRGFIELDKRNGARTDHNALILGGAIERVRGVLLGPAPIPDATAHDTGKKPRKLVTYSAADPKPRFSPVVEKVRTALSSVEGELTFAQLHALPELKDMNEGTLRWAIQVLRRAGACESKHTEAA